MLPTRTAVLAAIVIAAGCDSSTAGNQPAVGDRNPITSGDAAASGDAATVPADAGTSGAIDSGPQTPSDTGTNMGPDSGPSSVDSGAAGTPDLGFAGDTGVAGGATATVRGLISRTAALRSGLDGRGHLFVAVMDQNPVTDRATAQALGNQLIMDADLTTEGSTVPYRIEGVPVINAEVFLSAFFDDNGTADLNDPMTGPDRGDLVNLSLRDPLRVQVDAPIEYELDIVLNTALPF